MKKSIHWLLLLVSTLLLSVLQQSGTAVSTGETENYGAITRSIKARQQYQVTTAWPGNVSSAENRVSHQQLTASPEKTETDQKRRQQLIFNALSGQAFSCAKSLIHNTLQSSRRQPHFYSIIKENRQLRL